MNGRIFGISGMVIIDKVYSENVNLDNMIIAYLNRIFFEKKYAIMGLEYSQQYFDTFSRIRLNENPNIDEIINSFQDPLNKLDKYLDLSSGLENVYPFSSKIITIFDIFCDLEGMPVNELSPSIGGHAVTLQGMTVCDIEPDLGEIYLKIKNTWGDSWGYYSYLLVAKKMLQYASVTTFELQYPPVIQQPEQKQPNQSIIDTIVSKLRRILCSPTPFIPMTELSPLIRSEERKERRRIGLHKKGGNNRSRNKRKKITRKKKYRKKPARKTNRKKRR